MDTNEENNLCSYKEDYIKHHRHYFNGNVYRCSICFKKLKEDEVEVNNIIPEHKSGIHHHINYISYCHECNEQKSDTIDNSTYKQIAYKLYEELIILLTITTLSTIRLLSEIGTSLFKHIKDNKPNVKIDGSKFKISKFLNMKYIACLIVIVFILYKYLGRG